MNRWLADYLVEAHASLAKGYTKLIFRHPNDPYEIHVSDHDIRPGAERQTLSIQVILNCDDVDKVYDESREYLKSFLDLLSFVTNCKFSILSLRRIVDWTHGLVERYCIQFDEFPDPNIPVPILDDKIINTIKIVTATDVVKNLRNAFHWFSLGVSVQNPDEQFQFFWFALEVLAQLQKDKTLVADLCPKCRQPLYCQSCGEIPTHRPYEKQAIEQLIKKYVKGDNVDMLVEIAGNIRNAMLHGEPAKDIEKTLLIPFNDILNFLGKSTWIILVNIIRRAVKDSGNESRFMLQETNIFHHNIIVSEVKGTVKTPDCSEDPQIEKIPFLTVTMHIKDSPETD